MRGASVDISHPRPCSGAKTLRRRRNRVDTDNVVLIDVDTDGFDSVIIIDVPESLRSKYRSSRALSKDRNSSWETIICLDDDENSESNNAGAKVDGNLNNGASTSNSSHNESGNVGRSYGIAEDCEFVQENMSPLKLSKGKRTYSGKGSSASDYIDCELIEDSFRVREQWEKASWKRRCDTRNGQSGVRHPEVVLNEVQQNANVADEHDQHDEHSFAGKYSERNGVPAGSSEKENANPMMQNFYPQGEAHSPDWKDLLSKESEPPCENGHQLGSQQCEKDVSRSYAEEDAQNHSPSEGDEPLESVSNIRMKYDIGDRLPAQDHLGGYLMGEREKLKETDEYKKALEEELASRKQALVAQAEEAQKLRRLLKREKAESMRLLDMERRQKQRIEEIRETKKKDVEDMNLKEVIRASVRKELNQLEQSCHSMATLLQGLGILNNVLYPSPNEVRLAYKKALLTFHPDRAARSDLQHQVEAEEKFKLISRMKEKFLPAG